MKTINFVVPPRDINSGDFNAEMSDTDHNFLLYLINTYKPRKVLEVGVAAGGTSAFLLQNTRHLNPAPHIYGVDLATKWYRDKSKDVGYIVKEVCTEEDMRRYTLITGLDIIEAIEIVGPNIGLCLLDTVHELPGELLQFFAVYPYMNIDSVLAMHDISLNFHPESSPQRFWPNGYATKILYCTIVSKYKMLPNKNWPNIGAVILGEESKKYIENTFFALGITWRYFPSKQLLTKYANFISTHYSSLCLAMFNECVEKQAMLDNFINIRYGKG